MCDRNTSLRLYLVPSFFFTNVLQLFKYSALSVGLISMVSLMNRYTKLSSPCTMNGYSSMMLMRECNKLIVPQAFSATYFM